MLTFMFVIIILNIKLEIKIVGGCQSFYSLFNLRSIILISNSAEIIFFIISHFISKGKFIMIQVHGNRNHNFSIYTC